MSGGSADARNAWIKENLKLDIPQAGGDDNPFQQKWSAAVHDWRDATAIVSAQIGKLQMVLSRSGDKDLRAIGEFGLNAVTGNHLVRVTAAIENIARAGSDTLPGLADKAADLVADFEDHLRSDRRVALTEDNPFKIPVPIRTSLLPALGGLAQALQSVTP